jgi:hypothetical protein
VLALYEACGGIMWWRALLAGGLLAGLLGACAVVDPVDSRYDTVSRSLAKARDEAIFLNIIRASHDYPLAFTTIANVTPTMTNTSSFALPSFSLGPPNCLPTFAPAGKTITCSYGTGFGGAATALGSSTAANATAVSSNFNVSTEETGSFYQGFLKPIDLQILNYFIRQGYPRELLFWLFADSFQFQLGPSPVNALGYSYNPPDSYGCPKGKLAGVEQLCFRDWVWAALLAGLTVEDKTILKPDSSGSRSNRESKSDSGGGAKGAETTTVTRFCFSPFLQHEAVNDMGPVAATIKAYLPVSISLVRPDQLCGNWSNQAAQKQITEPQEDTFKLTFGPYTFRIVPRSAYGVFEFLGNLLKVQEGHVPPNPDVYVVAPRPGLPPVTDLPPILITGHDEPLITVLHGDSTANCFSHTWFYDGDYCVPEAAANTKRIFSLLSQLIAIETQATDLSITPVVRVIQ